MGCGASNNATSTTGPARNGNVLSRPVQKSKSYRHGSEITQRELDQQRSDFWATRSGGNSHMWQAIRSAVEALLSNDLPLATAILEASNISTPNGTLDVCYDERGYMYKVPIYCLANPQELRPSSGAGKKKRDKENSPRKESKPKEVGASIKLRIRINPGDYNLMVNATTTDSISELKQLIVKQASVNPTPLPELEEGRLRIMFMGKEIKNDQTVSGVRFDEQNVVQVFVRPQK